jgi:hypothetical protein
VNLPLTDERGDVDPSAFAALIESVERVRGLRFIRRPELRLVEPGAPELAALEEKAQALVPIREDAVSSVSRPSKLAEGAKITQRTGAPPRAAAFPDFERAVVAGLIPLEPGDVRRALGRLLDGQHYPRLVEAALRLQGDGGIALRALLAASANAVAAGSWFPGCLLVEADVLFKAPKIQGVVQGQAVFDAVRTPPEAAALLLLTLDDPETAFRSPPLSTRQLLSPAAYLASDRPIRLVGSPPARAGCNVVEDESFGVLRLLVGLSSSGASLTGGSFARWKGDRFLRFSCDDGRAPWIYVVEFSGERAPSDFEERIGALLPTSLARPPTSVILGPRIAAWEGIGAEVVKTFVRGLSSHEVQDFEEGP